MPAKKKTPKMTRGARAAMVIDRWATMESELAETKKKLAEANELLKSGQETMREHAGVVVELTEALRMKDLVLWNLEGNIRELAAESEWWCGQAADYQSELLAYVRDEARRAKPVVEES